MNAKIVRAGFLTTIQDLGRSGYRKIGVSLGGALDQDALRIANVLVGNGEDSAGLEITFGGTRIRFADDRSVAWCGADFEAAFPAGHTVAVRSGDELVFDRPRTGCRAWLAISGGIDVPVILGSRSTDLRARFGGVAGRALRDGEDIPLGPSPTRHQSDRISAWSAPLEWALPALREPTLRIVRGSEWERFEESSRFSLTTIHFDVTPDSNRMGARLAGPGLRLIEQLNLRSEPVVPGTVQVPPDGQPIILLGDCQTIGGYPKIAHVITVDLPLAAQLRAGDSVRFREVGLPEARQLLRQRQRDLARFRAGIQLRHA